MVKNLSTQLMVKDITPKFDPTLKRLPYDQNSTYLKP